MSILSKLRLAYDLVGLDIGSHTIKLAQFSSRKSPLTLETFAFRSVPQGVMHDGEIIDALALEEVLKDFFYQEKIKSSTIAFAVSGPAVISKKISIPSLSEEELKDQISVIAAQYLSCPIDDTHFDFQVLSSHASKLDISVVAVKKKFLESYCAVLEAIDLKAAIVETPATALANFFSELHAMKAPVGLIQIGASLSHFIILQNGAAIFSRDLAFGGNYITQNICKHLNLSFSEAEALKVTSHKEKHLPHNTLNIVQTSCQLLLSEIEQSLHLYSGQSSNASLEKLYICGGTAKIPSLCQWISQKTTLPTEIFNPFQYIQYNEKKFNPTHVEEVAPLFPVSLGLALRGVS